MHLEHPAWVTEESVPLSPMGNLLHKATLPIPGYVTSPQNTWKPTPGGCQNEETKRRVPNERTERTPEKALSKMETCNLSDSEFKTLDIRILSDLNENIDKEIGNIKMELKNIKNQSEMKKTLTEMRNTLQKINSRVDEAVDQISDLESKETRNT